MSERPDGPFIVLDPKDISMTCVYGSTLIFCHCGKRFYGSGKKAWDWARRQADKHSADCPIAQGVERLK